MLYITNSVSYSDLIPSFARRGKGWFLILFQKPLQPPLAKGRISQPITE